MRTAVRFNKIASRFTRGGVARALAGSKMENVFSREKSRRCSLGRGANEVEGFFNVASAICMYRTMDDEGS